MTKWLVYFDGKKETVKSECFEIVDGALIFFDQGLGDDRRFVQGFSEGIWERVRRVKSNDDSG